MSYPSYKSNKDYDTLAVEDGSQLGYEILYSCRFEDRVVFSCQR